MRILVIEDEDTLREQLKARFQDEGYVVDSAADGEEGHYMGTEFPIDLAVVDLGLPKISGLDVIRRWRASEKVFPILILTARGRWQEKVEGLESGADDYVVKPFHIEEVVARAKALLRRAAGWADSNVTVGYLTLDLSKGEVDADGSHLDLTAFEYKILEYLMLHAGEVVSKTALTEHIYPDDAERDSNVIEVFIRRLRKKLDPDGNRNPIETLRGRGYRLTMPE